MIETPHSTPAPIGLDAGEGTTRHALPSRLLHELRTPLNHIIGYSELLIEQAKGVLAERLQIDMSRAFETLRGYSRSHNEYLRTVAEGVISGSIDITALAATGVADPPAHRTRP